MLSEVSGKASVKSVGIHRMAEPDRESSVRACIHWDSAYSAAPKASRSFLNRSACKVLWSEKSRIGNDDPPTSYSGEIIAG